VTGGAGFIGSAVVDLLVAEGVEVVVLDVLLPVAHRREPSYLNPDATYVRADVRDPEAVAECLRGVDAVSHQAAMVGLGLDLRDAPGYAAHNDLGTAVLVAGLAAPRFTGRLVLASSMVVYGEGRYRCPRHDIVAPHPRPVERLRAGVFDPACPRCEADLAPEPVPESAALDPRSVYAATKLHQEHLCVCFARETGAALTILRYHNVYGPRMPPDTPYSGVAAIFRSALAAGKPPRVFEDGAQRRDFVHVADVARANVLALADDSRASHVCNVGTGSPATVLEMATGLCEATGSAIDPLVTGEFRLGDVRHVYACVDRAESALGFRARISLPEGMRDFAAAALR
jgi:dTDP-L-rhamnose 4-epimerase